MQFQILIFNGFEEMDVFGVFEPVRMAGLEVKLVSIEQLEHVVGFYGSRVIPDGALDVRDKPDV